MNDYTKTNGTNKDRRWAEGSTLISRREAGGRLRYFILYSANNYEEQNCVCLAWSKTAVGREPSGPALVVATLTRCAFLPSFRSAPLRLHRRCRVRNRQLADGPL